MPERGKTNRMATARKCFYFNWRGKTDRANTVSFSPVFFYTGKESKQFSRSNLGLKSKGGHTRVKASFLPNHPSFFVYRIDVKLGRERRRKTLYFCPVNDCLYTYLPTTTTSASGRTTCTTRPLCNRLSNLFMNQSRRPVFPPRTLNSLS